AVHADAIAHVLASPLMAQLDALTVAASVGRGLALWSRLPAAIELTIARSAVLPDCATTRVAWPGALHLARDADGVVGRASGDSLLAELVDHFSALPAALRRLEVEGAGDLAPPLS